MILKIKVSFFSFIIYSILLPFSLVFPVERKTITTEKIELRINILCIAIDYSRVVNKSKLIKLYNFPNQFNMSTLIIVNLKNNSDDKIDIYNIKGQHINSLVNKMPIDGDYTYKWIGLDADGTVVKSGDKNSKDFIN